ncbi:multiple organellar RNA editing factor 8, chloroplastic/mitochondrial-like [Panicum miliaceum]|uniref:Multiple organellar RNA editing factor 8, chloroplastic/mitochondrial-like n=1 Tax=Panicum miliaceum TaxID=4540 RepID=A0A3L6TDL4_PANMI|nr:multiple organellar RNA editing factor 8, chloroplastic/mitochondrial-like [Panicum miliaceum]
MASASRALRLASLSAPLRGGGAAVSSRPLAAAAGNLFPAATQRPSPPAPARLFSAQPATSSLRDSSPNWSNRPPKESILLEGCDFEHWLVVMDPPPGDPGNPDVPRDGIIDSYINTLAKVVGSEEEARKKIYSVSTRYYFAFGALVSEELSYKIKELPNVRWVLPDSYLDVKNKDYGGEPFINGQAVPYDPKYHEEWVRNNERANNRIRRNDRPRNTDRSRSFDRRENMQNFQTEMCPLGRDLTAPVQGRTRCHLVTLLRCTLLRATCRHLHQMLVLRRRTNHILQTISKVVLLATKVALVVTCMVARALLTRATTLGIKVEGQLPGKQSTSSPRWRSTPSPRWQP